MARLFNPCLQNIPAVLGSRDTQTRTTFVLDTAYTYGSAGKAVGFRFIAPVTANLTDIYFFSTAIAGTPGNLLAEVRNYGASTTVPGTLITSESIAPAGAASKWLRATLSTPAALTQGTGYWISIGDAAGSGTNKSTLLSRGGTISSSASYNFLNALTTTNGWSTGTSTTTVGTLVLKFSDGTLMGAPYTTTAAYASSALERGFYLNNLNERITVSGVTWANTSANFNAFKIYDAATAPGGTALLSVAIPASAAAIGALFFDPYTLAGNTAYRIVLGFGAAETGPNYANIEDAGTFADLLLAGALAGNAYACIDDGAGGWTDTTSDFPLMALFLEDVPIRPVYYGNIGGTATKL